MAQLQNQNNSDLNDRQNAVLERLEALETKNRILKEEIALLKSAKHRHYLLIGLLFYMLLVAVPLFSGTLYLCMLINNPWILFMAFITGIFLGYLLSSTFYLMRDWAETASQAMCEPLRELLEMAKAHEADRRELRQEEEAIRRVYERRRYQEKLQREMAGLGRNAEDEDVARCTICLERLNLYGDVVILACQHIFHRACIELWLPHKDTCPICRTKIDSNYWRIANMDDD